MRLKSNITIRILLSPLTKKWREIGDVDAGASRLAGAAAVGGFEAACARRGMARREQISACGRAAFLI